QVGRPLDDGHPVPLQKLLQPQGLHVGRPLQAVEVHVVQGEPPVVDLHQGEAGAGHLLWVDPQAEGGPRGHQGLARPQSPPPPEDIPRLGPLAQPPAQGPGPLRAGASRRPTLRPEAPSSYAMMPPSPRCGAAATRAASTSPRKSPRCSGHRPTRCSGCHWTPTQKWSSPARSMASTTPSLAWATARNPGATWRTAW